MLCSVCLDLEHKFCARDTFLAAEDPAVLLGRLLSSFGMLNHHLGPKIRIAFLFNIKQIWNSASCP
jgi:hypothetical protein